MTRLKWVMVECIAVALWIYILLKLAVFDVDVYAFDRLAPDLRWILNLKAFILMAVFAVIWIVVGWVALLYIATYPVIILLWKLPKLAFRKSPLVIAAAPAIYRVVTTLRTTYLIYTMAALSGLLIMLRSPKTLLAVAMVALGIFLAVHLTRSFRKAYSASAFEGLSLLARKLRESVQQGKFDGQTDAPSQGTAPVASSTAYKPPGPSVLYLLRWLADIIDDKLQVVARGRRYDLVLVVGWLYTVIITCAVFAFEYLALQEIDPSSFKFTAGAGFWAFLGFSLAGC